MPVMAISICKILCVPMVTSIGFKWERLFLYLVYILAGLTAWLVGVCWSIFFLRKQSVVNNWFISFLSSLIVCTFPQNESHVGLLPTATWPWTYGGSALSTSPQAQHWLWNPGSPWPGKLFSGLSNLKNTTHPSHVHGRSKPGHLQDSVVERHVCLRNQHLELISVQAKWTGETFKHKSFF